MFRGRRGENETDWIKLRRKRPRLISINYEKLFKFNKENTATAVYKSYEVSARITASKSWFDHMEKMKEKASEREERKRERMEK